MMTSSLKWAWLSFSTSLTPGGSVDGAACPKAGGTTNRIAAATTAPTAFLWRDIHTLILVIYQYDAAPPILRPASPYPLNTPYIALKTPISPTLYANLPPIENPH